MKFKRFFLFALEFLYRKKRSISLVFCLFFFIQLTHRQFWAYISGPFGIICFFTCGKKEWWWKGIMIFTVQICQKIWQLFFSKFWFCEPNGIANMRFRYTRLKLTTHLILFHSFYQCNTLGCIAHATHDINVFRLYSTLSDDERSSSFWFFLLQSLHVFHCYFFSFLKHWIRCLT